LGILVGQDVRDVGDVVEKFTGASRVPGVTPRSGVVIVGVGPPFTLADIRGGLCYLDAVEPEPRGPAPKSCLSRVSPNGTPVFVLPVPAEHIGTGTVQRVVIEQPRPCDVGVAEAAFASQ